MNKSTRATFALNVSLYVKAERREEFIECILANQRATLSEEPLACSYVWGEDATEPLTFHFSESYVTREGFEAHTTTAHFAAWEAFAATDPFTKDPEVRFFTIHVDPQLK
jgi:quinol monooxygenase YgiN